MSIGAHLSFPFNIASLAMASFFNLFVTFYFFSTGITFVKPIISVSVVRVPDVKERVRDLVIRHKRFNWVFHSSCFWSPESFFLITGIKQTQFSIPQGRGRVIYSRALSHLPLQSCLGKHLSPYLADIKVREARQTMLVRINSYRPCYKLI